MGLMGSDEMSAIEYLERPQPGTWFVLDVMQRKMRGQDWVALMVDVDPCGPRSFLMRQRNERWLLIPGKHRNRDAAMAALDELNATRH